MEEVFDPVVNDVLRLVGQQVDNISQTKGKRINVGLSPFGDCDPKSIEAWTLTAHSRLFLLVASETRTISSGSWTLGAPLTVESNAFGLTFGN